MFPVVNPTKVSLCFRNPPRVLQAVVKNTQFQSKDVFSKKIPDKSSGAEHSRKGGPILNIKQQKQ